MWAKVITICNSWHKNGLKALEAVTDVLWNQMRLWSPLVNDLLKLTLCTLQLSMCYALPFADIKKEKVKKKSPITRWFSMKSKRASAENWSSWRVWLCVFCLRPNVSAAVWGQITKCKLQIHRLWYFCEITSLCIVTLFIFFSRTFAHFSSPVFCGCDLRIC